MPKKLQLGLLLALILIALAVPVGVLAKNAAQGTGNAYVMVGNFSPNSPRVNILVNGTVLGRNLSFSQATFPATVKPGDIFIEVRNASTNALIVDGYKTVNANDYYMVPFMNTVERAQFGAYRIPVYETLAPTETRVQFFHAVPRGPRLDVFNINTSPKQVIVDAMGYVEDPTVVDHVPAGNYRYQVWTDYRTIFPGAMFNANPLPDNLVIDLGNLALRARVIYSFFIIGSNNVPGQPPTLALVLAMPYGGGAPVAPPTGGTSSTVGSVGGKTNTPGPSPTPTKTATATPTPTPTFTPTPIPPKVSFTSDAYGVGEGNLGTMQIQLDKSWPTAISVSYSTTTGGTAVAGSDFPATSGSVTFNPGETLKTISLGTSQDLIDEPQESIFVQLSNPSSPVQFGSPSTSALIINDDDPTPTINLSSSALTILGGNNATLTVTISNPSSQAITATLAQTGGTATGSDYSLSTNSINIPPGSSSQTITLTTAVVSSNKTLTLNLQSISGANLGSSPVNITITATPTSTPLPTATNTPTPTLTPTSTPSSVVTLNTSPVGGAIAEGTGVLLTVSINYIPTGGVSVTVQATGISAGFNQNDITMPGSPGFGIGCSGTTCTIPFTTGDPLNKSFAITIRDDGPCPQESAEAFNFAITNSTGATIGTPNTSSFTINADAPATPCP